MKKPSFIDEICNSSCKKKDSNKRTIIKREERMSSKALRSEIRFGVLFPFPVFDDWNKRSLLMKEPKKGIEGKR